MAFAKVRVGIKVTRTGSKHFSFDYEMFYCRSKDRGNKRRTPISDWMRDVVECMPYSVRIPSANKLKIGESARYFVQIMVEGYTDYWGEYDENVAILKCRRIK